MSNSTAPQVEHLLVDLKTAAGRLMLSPRTLWQKTKDGELPVVRIGRSVRFDVRDLVAFIDARKVTTTDTSSAKGQRP